MKFNVREANKCIFRIYNNEKLKVWVEKTVLTTIENLNISSRPQTIHRPETWCTKRGLIFAALSISVFLSILLLRDLQLLTKLIVSKKEENRLL